ncbi:MAG: PTS sugar transporter subunit IIB [Desulfovibrionaceae bacterium]|jgi:PTS system mannose-specific IIB component|nr:PTS sugar transporter subunit IIB [Desulfovibrionaceae bacterium]
MFWVRIDNRLVHGQIIEAWVPFTGAKLLLVANDRLQSDPLQQEIVSLAIPGNLEADFVRVDEVNGFLQHALEHVDRADVFVLFSSCRDARRGYENGLGFGVLNVGNLHYAPGKKQVCSHVALSDDDENCLNFFAKKGVELDFRCVPNETIQVRSW